MDLGRYGYMTGMLILWGVGSAISCGRIGRAWDAEEVALWFAATCVCMPLYAWIGAVADGWRGECRSWGWLLWLAGIMQVGLLRLPSREYAAGWTYPFRDAFLLWQAGALLLVGTAVCWYGWRQIQGHFATEERIANFYEGLGFENTEEEQDWSERWDEGEGGD